MFTARQKEIIDASIRLIARKGIQEVTMKNLSREVGISEPALYRHFKNKHEILVGVLDSFDYYNKLITETVNDNGGDAIEKLKTAVLQVFRKFSQHTEIASVIFSEEIFQNEEDLAARVKEIMAANGKAFTKLIEEGIQSGGLRGDIDKDDMSLIILGVMRLLVIHWRLSRYSFDLVERGEQVFERTIRVLLAK